MVRSSSPDTPARTDPDPARVVADEAEIARAVTRMAHQILEANRGPADLLLLGIPTRGVPLAQRLATAIEQIEGQPVRLGELDITMYRDDLRSNPTRAVRRTMIPGTVDDAVVVLVDDVLYSGRSVAAAIDALRDLGRPQAVRLAVLVDRGHRELPIAADHVGRVLPTAADEHVKVELTEVDGRDAVTILRPRRAHR